MSGRIGSGRASARLGVLLAGWIGLTMPVLARDVYVAPNGSDGAAGTLPAPLATLIAAPRHARPAIEERAVVAG